MAPKDFGYFVVNSLVAAVLLTLGIVFLVTRYLSFKSMVIGVYAV